MSLCIGVDSLLSVKNIEMLEMGPGYEAIYNLNLMPRYHSGTITSDD